MTRYSGHGKLLLTAEYAVLDGAIALALPTRFGQTLDVESKRDNGLDWRSLDRDGTAWFEGSFSQNDSGIVSYEGSSAIGRQLATILNAALLLRKDGPEIAFHHSITTRLEFDRNWGLGSSSTLIHLLAKWLEVDPLDLLFNTIGGSGYDVACAAADGPILYQLRDGKPSITRVSFQPPFKDELCFVYLGKKQKSSEAIAHYRQQVQEQADFIDTVSKFTREMLECDTLEVFEDLLRSHEDILSKTLQMPAVQLQFPDCPGRLKSLGAWGGDFILATRAAVAGEYFKKKGLTPVIPFSEMIL